MSVVPVPRRAGRHRVTFAGVLRSEWTKLWTVRSTLWSLGVGMFLSLAFPLLFAALTASHWDRMSLHEQADRHPLDIALAGVNVAQLAIAVLGVLVITAEYSTGMIRASLTAVPKRLPVLWAKSLVFGAVTFACTLPAVLLAFFASQAILNAHHGILQISFSQAGVARSVVGGALYVTLVALFALGIGAAIRSTAGGIATFVGIFFVIPPLMNVLPQSWNDAITQYLPSEAGRQLFSLDHAQHTLTPLAGGLLFAGYVAAALAIAAALLARRDA